MHVECTQLSGLVCLGIDFENDLSEERVMKKYIFGVMLLSMAMIAIPAHAGNYYCTGTLTFLAVSQSGTVEVAGPGGLPNVYVCQLGATANGWNPDSCKAAFSVLLAAKTTGQQVNIIFQDNLNSCTAQPTYNPSTESNISWVGPA
jgi:hypothetical protein